MTVAERAQKVAARFLNDWGLRWNTEDLDEDGGLKIYPRGAGSALVEVALAVKIEEAIVAAVEQEREAAAIRASN